MVSSQATAPAAMTNTAHNSWVKRHPIFAMLALMFLLAWPLMISVATDSYGLTHLHLPQWLGLLVGWAPGIAAFVITASVSGKSGVRELMRKTLRWRVGGQWYLLAFGGVAVLILGGVGVYGLLTGNWLALPVSQMSLADFALSFVALVGLGLLLNTEEIAWRGFMLPRLQSRYNALIACLLIAIPEALLHLPLFFTKGSFFQQEGPVAFGLFTLALVILYTWVFNNTRGSVLICTLMHAAQNAWSNLIAPDSAITPFYFVVGFLCLIAIVLAIVDGPARLSHHPGDEAFTF